MQLTSYLALMKEQDASDLFVSVGAPINMKVHGKTGHVGQQPLSGSDVRELAYGLISDEQRKEFEENLELNFAISNAMITYFMSSWPNTDARAKIAAHNNGVVASSVLGQCIA